jgi:ABC-2 type transport system permease protein
MAAFYVLVGVVFRQGGPETALFIFISLVVWKFFVAAIRNALPFTAAKERQMRHVRFPRIVLPISAVFAESVRFGFGLVVLVITAIALGHRPGMTLPFVLIVAIIQLIFSLGLAFMLAALNIFFRDVQHVTAYAFQAWFFLSPGLYPVSAIPADYRSLYELNPYATILPAYHAILLDNSPPNWVGLGKCGVFSLALVLIGYLLFVRLEPAFAKVR